MKDEDIAIRELARVLTEVRLEPPDQPKTVDVPVEVMTAPDALPWVKGPVPAKVSGTYVVDWDGIFYLEIQNPALDSCYPFADRHLKVSE